MLNSDISTCYLKKSLRQYITPKNKRVLNDHLRFFFGILKHSPEMYFQSKRLLSEGVLALKSNDYWLQLEIESKCLSEADDILLRRCLMRFVAAYTSIPKSPSRVEINSINIDCLAWYRKSRVLGDDVTRALLQWEKNSQLAPISRLSSAQNAMACLRGICICSGDIEKKISKEGLGYFGDAAQYNCMLNNMYISNRQKVMKRSLLAILATYYPDKFKSHFIFLSEIQVDVTNLYYLSPLCVKQLTEVSLGSRVSGEKGHSKDSITHRFRAAVNAIRLVFIKYAKKVNVYDLGLDAFELEDYTLLKKAKEQLSRYQFRELVLLLGEHRQRPVLKHYYQPELLPFYFFKLSKYRTINFSELAEKSTKLFNEVRQLHQSEIEYLAQKNYDMTTLHSRFVKLKYILINMVLLEHKDAANNLGLACLSTNNNQIQKSLFQKIQSKVKSQDISIKSAEAFYDVIHWVMGLTGQEVVEVFLVSSKHNQRHAKRSRMEDLYTEDELRELVFYIEKGLKTLKENEQIVALYFARIQLKTCWNTSPLSDIELSDIYEVELPTANKSITVLTQKPRKGYSIDCYQLDGRTVGSVMHDILYVRDNITKEFREDTGEIKHNYLFIYKKKSDIERLDPSNITSYIKNLLKTCGCSVNYNSMKIRKSGANYIYREVVKNLRDYESHTPHACESDMRHDYESHMRHDFETFIQNYQRINEVDIQQTLHDAIDVMQRYFMGREISPDIKILTVDDPLLQKTPVGECSSLGNDKEAQQYRKEHTQLQKDYEFQSEWCSDYLACIWCKHFRTVADPEHVWQLLSYRNYVLADMSISISNISNNKFQKEAITALHERVDAILTQLAVKSQSAVTQGKQLLKTKGMHFFWSFAITAPHSEGVII